MPQPGTFLEHFAVLRIVGELFQHGGNRSAHWPEWGIASAPRRLLVGPLNQRLLPLMLFRPFIEPYKTGKAAHPLLQNP